MNTIKVILASASPRRRDFLRGLGIAHTSAVADIDETPGPGEEATALASRLALGKAEAVSRKLEPSPAPVLIIGADTVVALDGALLGKPDSAADAIQMLERLRGRTHQVHSALALLHRRGADRKQRLRVNTTHVTMRDYSGAEIAAYVATGDPLDKAGGYAIQHRGFEPVAGLDGCPAGVMGLPAADLLALLAEFGVTSGCALPQACSGLTGLPCCRIDSPSGG